MNIKEYCFNYNYSDFILNENFPCRGALCRSIYPLKDLKLHHNSIFVISRIEKITTSLYTICAYRIKINTIFNEPERVFLFSDLVYCFEDMQLWEERLNKHLGLNINSRFEILDIR